MTIIEFYDKSSIENIAAALLCRPERVILVGDNKKVLARAVDRYQEILEKHGIATQISHISVDKNDLTEIAAAFGEIVEKYDDCAFDLTGGEDMYLVAVGYIKSRYEDKVQCQRFNLRNGTLNDCDKDGKVCKPEVFKISIEDNIRIYGGEIVTDPQRDAYTYPWDFNEDFEKDIDLMWDICRKNTRLWNSHIGTLSSACEMFKWEDPLSVCFEKKAVTEALEADGYRFVCVTWIMNELQKRGLIHSLIMSDWISFSFKNEQVKQSLTVAGQVLELAVAKTLRSLKDKNGDLLYDDVKVGVVIDWDGGDETDEYRTVNEIDVVAIKGVVPIYISCKNGDFDVNELYKLSTVADRFGGKYAKKALVSTELGTLGAKSDYIRARMKDMNIRSIDNIDEMTDPDLEKELRKIWNN